MIKTETYIENLISLLNEHFDRRLLYVGLQGSYLRNEADDDSDIDIMVILDDISPDDLDAYRNIIMTIGDFDKSCGFICGKSELANWNPLEICHLAHTTKDCYGNLVDFVPQYKPEDEKNYIKLSLNNLFHELCHRYIHSSREHNISKLPAAYKAVFFIIQNMYYLKTGKFITTKAELINRIDKEDKKVLAKAIEIKNKTDYDFDNAFDIIFEWCKKAICRI
jgi:predicted nucleotidyltransferase